jgi:hypothetical protein
MEEIMKTKWFACLACLGLAIWLAGCMGTRGGGGTPVYPECDPNYMVEPSLVSPIDGNTIASLEPMFEWAYPGYYIANGPQQQGQFRCYTPGFHLYLSSGPFFQDELGTQTDGVPGFDSLYTKIWTPDTPLEPGTEYRWSIRPISHGEEGPSSELRTFFTGPLCEAGSLAAPIPISPINHWIVDDLGDLALYWYYPGGCVPDGYAVELSDSLVFDGSPLNVNLDTPSTRWEMGAQLEDCTRYYWRVSAVRDDQQGHRSQVYTFRVDLTGSCAPEVHGMIQGTVWEDQCAAPGDGTPMPDVPPLGCVYPTPGAIFTNQSYDPGEPGIPGLVVSLGLGACPSSGLRDVATWQDGMFDFYMISPGTYCVSVESQNPYNTTTLLPGRWTYPADTDGNTLASQTVTVNAGQDLTNVNFGWWYEFGAAWGSTNAAVFGNVWHDLCAFTPGDPIPDPLPDGCSLDQWGNVHADAIRQADEPGIPGVVVDIGPGDCPSAGLATAVTDADGYYSFADLPAGDYCLRIDPEHGSTNTGILMPGSWTVIPSGHEGMTFRAISLTVNHTLSGQDFGWDYDNLPAMIQIPHFTLAVNAYCRHGPGENFDISTYGMTGQSYAIEGLSEDGNWFYVRFNDSLQCWMASSRGTSWGELGSLPVVPAPAPPLVNCSQYTVPATCAAQSACSWKFSAAGPGFCTNK